ncbi:retrovirus-related pol polyprotein from transposon TNT 1-94 [Tanacetum coccineum]
MEPKKVNEALKDESWIIAMQEELNQFIANDVWELVPQPKNMTIIGTKWVYRNKLDENGVVSRNKAGLVAQGYNQQEGIDYDETYAPVARLKSIRILIAYACALDLKLFQMDVKSAFLNGFINEEVYMAQPLGFIDFEKLDHVYKLKKALYGLKQAPKAWFHRLKAFLIKHEYNIRIVDNTLFTKKKSLNLIIVQIYVDDIIFGSTCQDMCDDFAKIMHDEFEMSMMGELNFFLGLQIKQKEDDIFFNKSKYIKGMLKKFVLEDSKPMKTPMSLDAKLMKDEECTTNLVLWYPKGTGIETVVYADSDHAGDYVDRKSTSEILKNLESHCIHEGRVVYLDFDDLVYVRPMFGHIGFDCLLDINEQIIPRFILEFYSQYRVNYTLEGQMLIEFVIQNQLYSYNLEEFGQILDIPFKGECSFTDKWSLDDLQFSVPTDGPYKTNPPCLDEIKNYVQEEREGPVTRIRHDKVIDVEDNQILTREIVTTRKDYGTRRGRSSTSFSSAFGQPSSSHSKDDDNDGNDEGTSLASTPSPPRFVNSLSNDIPQIFSNPPDIDPNMEALYTRQTKILNRQVQLRDEQRGGIRSIGKAIKNLLRGKKKNEEDYITTPSPITKFSSPSPPNATSKTPYTKDTSSTFGTTSSSFDSKPQSSPLSSKDTPSPQPSNPFLDDIIDAPSRPSNLLPLQIYLSLDITLSLSPITPLDHILDTPSPPSL